MKCSAALPFLFLMVFFAGCDWSPERDNSRDPGSQDYDGPPVIQKLWIEAHCQEGYSDYCWMDILVDIYDPEGISTSDRVQVLLEGEPLGWMSYDGIRSYFVFTIHEDSIGGDLCGTYLTSNFQVRFTDDAGYTIEGNTDMTRCIQVFSQQKSPKEYDDVGPRPQFIWQKFPKNYYFTYRIGCYLYDFLLWDSLNISKGDTSVVIGDSLPDSELGEFYYWTISVVDIHGNSATSKRAYFQVSYSGMGG